MSYYSNYANKLNIFIILLWTFQVLYCFMHFYPNIFLKCQLLRSRSQQLNIENKKRSFFIGRYRPLVGVTSAVSFTGVHDTAARFPKPYQLWEQTEKKKNPSLSSETSRTRNDNNPQVGWLAVVQEGASRCRHLPTSVVITWQRRVDFVFEIPMK